MNLWATAMNLWATAALAGPLVQGESIPLNQTPLDLWVSETHLVYPDGERLRQVDLTGLEERRVGSDAVALAAHDIDGDGTLDVVTCGPSGLFWTPTPIRTPIQLDESPCLQIVGHSLGPGGIATAELDVRIYDQEANSLGLPTVYAAGLSDPMLSARDGAVGWADVGDTAISVIDAYGLASLPVGGYLTGLAPSQEGWWLASDPPPSLRDTEGSTLVPIGVPGQLQAGDVDGDGLTDVAVLYPMAVGVIAGIGTPEQSRVLEASSDWLRLADLDGDGCDEVLTADPTLPGVAVSEVESCLVDRDLDGFVAGSDCDDLDRDVFPGATEHCNGIDDDCDGEVDEPELVGIDTPTDSREGETALVWVQTLGCADQAWTWSVAPQTTAIACDADGPELRCELLDDAEVEVTVVAVDLAGAEIAAATGILSVENVTPDMDFPDDPSEDDLADGDVLVAVGDTWSSTPSIRDPGVLDTHEVVAEGAPDWIEVGALGTVTISPVSVTSVQFELVLSDDDGGTTRAPLLISTYDPDPPEEEPDNGGDGAGLMAWVCAGSIVIALLLAVLVAALLFVVDPQGQSPR